MSSSPLSAPTKEKGNIMTLHDRMTRNIIDRLTSQVIFPENPAKRKALMQHAPVTLFMIHGQRFMVYMLSIINAKEGNNWGSFS